MLRAFSKRALSSTAAHLMAAGLLVVAQSAAAQSNSAPAPYVTNSVRADSSSRPVAALLAQTDLATSIDLGRVAGPAGGNGGLLGVLVIAAMDRTTQRLSDNATMRADSQISPLRAAIAGLDVNTMAVDGTRVAFAGLLWFNAGETELTLSDPASQDSRSALRPFALAHPNASQLGLISWRYQMSADFSQVQVIALVEIVDRSRLTSLYRQQLISIVKLDRPSFAPEENVARWSANGGTPARRALSMAFARAAQVIPIIMTLDQNGHRNATDRRRTDRVIAAGFEGPILLRDEAGPVFWARDGDRGLAAFVAVQTVSEQP